MEAAVAAAPGRVRVWLLAARPRTLPLSLVPVVIGTAFAARDGVVDAGFAALAALGAALLQLVSNLVNDLGDAARGADGPERRGPLRVVAAGLVTPARMRGAIVGVALAAVLVGAALVARGGWPIAVIGGAGLLSAFLYTAGPRPLGWLGLGEVLVFVFFGPAAVGGAYFVQALQVPLDVVIAGAGPGLLAAAVLLVNNIRDRDNDARVGKRTLAVRAGKPAALLLYGACLFGAVAAVIPALGAAAVCTLPLLVPGLRVWRGVAREEGVVLDRRLGQTAALALLFAALVVIAVAITAAVAAGNVGDVAPAVRASAP